MTKLALGTVQFGLDYGVSNVSGQVSLNEAKKILKFAENNNINMLDTASSYGNSEENLGKIGVDNFQIITKTTSLQLGVDNALKSFYRSLKKLNVTSIEGLLVHNVDDTKNKKFDYLYKELQKLKQDKLINKIGFSTYNPEQVDFLLRNFDFDLIQVPLNVFDSRLIDGGQLQALKNKQIEIHARSIFLQGALLNYKNLSNYFLSWKKQFTEYQSMVKNSGLSLLEYALNFSLNIQEIDKILVGVNSENQLKEIVQAVKKKSSLDSYPIDDINLLNPSLWKL